MLASFLQINLCSKCCTTLLINTPPHFKLSLSTGTKQDRDRYTKKKSPTTDIEKDKPRSMASLTSAHYSSVIPLLLFILFIVSLSTVFCISLLCFIIKLLYVPGQELPSGLTPGTQPFQRESPCVCRNRSPCRRSAFSSLPPGILQDQRLVSEDNLTTFLGLWGSFEKEPGAQKRQMRSRSHMQQLAQLGRKDRAVARAPIRAPQILLPFLPSSTPSVLYEPFHTAD